MVRVARLPHLVPNVITDLRLTIPAREALRAAGNSVTPGNPIGPMLAPGYAVQLLTPPPGLVLVLIGQGDEQHRGVRGADEPPYPEEWPDGQGIAWWERGDWTPCATCGAALLWCEVGFVPGWRVCLSGHASQLSGDGRAVERHAEQDAATLRATERARRCPLCRRPTIEVIDDPLALGCSIGPDGQRERGVTVYVHAQGTPGPGGLRYHGESCQGPLRRRARKGGAR